MATNAAPALMNTMQSSGTKPAAAAARISIAAMIDCTDEVQSSVGVYADIQALLDATDEQRGQQPEEVKLRPSTNSLKHHGRQQHQFWVQRHDRDSSSRHVPIAAKK